MASENDKGPVAEKKGFAGLASMVTDVDATVASTRTEQKREHKESSTQRPKQEHRSDGREQASSTQQNYQVPAPPSSDPSVGKWLVVIAVIIGVLWLANQPDDRSPSRLTHSPGTSSTTDSRMPSSQPQQTRSPATPRPTEQKPSVGRNQILSTAQIRYCVAEKIRLDAAETVINRYVGSDVVQFNAYINDYNSRCGQFRYRQGALTSVRKDVEPYRLHLQAEGRSRFVGGTSGSQPNTQASQRVRPSPDPTVQAIQRLLNEHGYNAGPVDGLFGRNTRAAIEAFQRNKGYAVDGLATEHLLRQLRQSD